MANFLKSLFFGETDESEETKLNRNFDVLKYDGIKALKIGKNTYAIRCFNEALKLKEDVEVLEHLVGAYNREDRMEEAIKTAGRLVDIEPDNIPVLLMRANLNFMAEKYEAAIADCNRVIALDATNASAYYLAAKAKKAAGDVLGTIVSLSQAITIKEDFAEALLLRAEMMLSTRDYKDGLQDIEKVIGLMPEEENAFLIRGRLHEALGDDQAAEQDYEVVTGLNPFNEQAYLQLGTLYIAREQPDKAIELFDEAIELKPEFPRAYSERGRAKLMKGDKNGSVEDLKKALEELIDNYRCGHEKATINLDFQLKDPEIFADPFHLIHLVDNLISNALKYAGEKAEIQISCKQEKPNKLLISVKDNGPGVSTHSRKRIFRTGFRTNHRHQNSHGIGLAYVRKIVRQYNGHIQIKSKENEGSEFCLSLCLDKPKSYKKSVSSSHIYRYFFIALLLAEMVWMFNLYSAERTNFVNHKNPLIDETIFKMSKNLFQIRDTARFQNNWQENSITITRGVKDTTVEMGGIVNQSYVYGRLSYDLRDSSWCLDSLVHYYKKSDLPFPIFFIRKDANGKIIDRYPSEDPNIFLPAIFRMPLGYVERHRLEVQLAYPWLQPLTTHKIWLLFALLSILLSGWFTHLLMAVDRRQKALIHLQRNEVQHFLRELQVQLCHLHGTESDHPSPAIPISPPIHTELLHKNIKQYENMIIKINYLLDKLTILKTHPMILYHDYGY